MSRWWLGATALTPNQLFHWRKLYQDGSLSAVSSGQAVVPASELADALKQIRELQRVRGCDQRASGRALSQAGTAIAGKPVLRPPEASRSDPVWQAYGPLQGSGCRIRFLVRFILPHVR